MQNNTQTPQVSDISTTPPAIPSPPSQEANKQNILRYAFIGIVAIILIGGGLYSLVRKPKIETTKESVSPTVTLVPTTSAEPVLSSSDEVDVLEKEINETNVSGIDAELDDLNSELNNL